MKGAERERCGDRMNGGIRITSGREKEKEGEIVEKQIYKGEDATAAAFVKRCQIFNPGVLSVLLCNR